NSHSLELGKRTLIMGVLNVTPDSFSDGGIFFNFDNAVAHGEKLANDGADIIDIGGESTRPFSDPVTVEEEIERVVPVIEKLAERISIPISIDTTKAKVARRALEAGASIVNDIGALRLDPGMASVVSEFGVPLILMHMLGTPKTMQDFPKYDDLIKEIKSFLADAIKRAEKSKIPKTHIIIDPGIGFGKTVEHNLLLIKNLHQFSSLNTPVLIGSSRKAFIRKILKDETDQDIRPDLPIVETGTQASIAAAILNGAHIIRVHDVANTFATVKVADAIKRA
ncbi:MAG: dihydropteroate synthase, partial [Deltaproteobacteria bacterium]|nr:dihydropteroate synthase [Deltaproteobacteria bacterium]